MADMESARIKGWDAVRTRWRRDEDAVRAPVDLVDQAVAEFESERSAARKRVTMLGLSVAASILVMLGTWSVLPVDQEIREGELAGLAMPGASDSVGADSGACAEPGSCIDLVQALASIDSEALLLREMPGGVHGSQANAIWAPD